MPASPEIREATRRTWRWVQSIEGPPEAVFPLLCPVRERDWLPGWDARVIHSRSGYAEAGCVFATAQHGAAETVWVVVDHEPPHRIRFVRFTPDQTVVEIAITVDPFGSGRSSVSIEYTHTALSEAGAATVAGMTEAAWRNMMAQWETAMNHYLTTGTVIAE